MRVLIGLENQIEGRSLAWALEYPGCFAYGEDQTTALVALARALVNYETWVRAHTLQSWVKLGDFDLRLVDSWDVYDIDEEFNKVPTGKTSINAWFQQDWKPLTRLEATRGAQLLAWTREDLLETVRGFSVAELDRDYPGERWNIRGILKHIATAEWWYLDRLNLTPSSRTGLPDDVFERLQVVRARLEDVLPDLAGDERVWGKDGELWSSRKLLRRALWHERDHIIHICKLIASC